MQNKDVQSSESPSSSPIHIVGPKTPTRERLQALRALHLGLVQAERNLFNLLHANGSNPSDPSLATKRAKRLATAVGRDAGFTIAEAPFDFHGLPAAKPSPSAAPSYLVPWTPWSDPVVAARQLSAPDGVADASA